jgi:single-strand DNA-binding protein
MNEHMAALLRASRHNFVGRLARDPEVKYLDSGNSVCNARILINKPGAKRDDGQQPDGFNLAIWGDQGVAFADQCRKGQLVEVVGRVKTDSWTDRNTGEVKNAWTVTVDRWAPVATGAPGPAPSAAPAPRPAAAAQATPSWSSAAPGMDDDSSIPF